MIYPTNAEIEAEVRKAALERNINPDVAVKIWASEGKSGNPTENWQSKLYKNGKREDSHGPMQLYAKGLGADAPFDIRDPKNWKKNIAFGLDYAAANRTWAPWYGRKQAKVGINEGFGPNSQAMGLRTTSAEPVQAGLSAPGTEIPIPVQAGLSAPNGPQIVAAGGGAAKTPSPLEAKLAAWRYAKLTADKLPQGYGSMSGPAPSPVAPAMPKGTKPDLLKVLGGK